MSDLEEGAWQRAALGDALRRARLARGMTNLALSRRVHVSTATISRIENGKSIPSAEDVARILDELQVAGGERERILRLARVARVEYEPWRVTAMTGMHRKQEQIRRLTESARLVRMFLPAVPSGYLQTEEYARAVLSPSVPGWPGRDVERVVAARMARQELLQSEETRFRFVLTEQALRWRPNDADPAVVAAQCAHMADLAQSRPNIEIAVVPLGTGVPSPLNTFVLYDERLVVAELLSGEVVLRDPADIAYHANLWQAFYERALSGGDAVAFLRQAATSAYECVKETRCSR